MDPNYVGSHICSAFWCTMHNKEKFGVAKKFGLNFIEKFKLWTPEKNCFVSTTWKSRIYMITNIVWFHLNSIWGLDDALNFEAKSHNLLPSKLTWKLPFIIKSNFWASQEYLAKWPRPLRRDVCDFWGSKFMGSIPSSVLWSKFFYLPLCVMPLYSIIKISHTPSRIFC